MENKLIEIINSILNRKGHLVITELEMGKSLRTDFGFDSLDLAELTVKIEDQFDCDIFEDGLVDLIQEVYGKIVNAK